MTPQELQNLLDELEALRASRRRASVLKDAARMELPQPARKTINWKAKRVGAAGAQAAGLSPFDLLKLDRQCSESDRNETMCPDHMISFVAYSNR
jgi:hypothetical protein